MFGTADAQTVETVSHTGNYSPELAGPNDAQTDLAPHDFSGSGEVRTHRLPRQVRECFRLLIAIKVND